MSDFNPLTHDEITSQLAAADTGDVFRTLLCLLSRCNASGCKAAMQFVESQRLLPVELSAKLCGRPSGDSNEAAWVEPVAGSKMIWIGPGPFYLGSQREPHRSGGYYLAEHPVTNQQFQQFLSETNYQPTDSLAGDFLTHWKKKMPLRLAQHPVTWVSMIDALHYCHWAGLDLPTQWLWEKAARGPDGDTFPWGSNFLRSKTPLANVCSTSTKPIGKYAKVRSHYGCQDLVGNVSEWCHVGDAQNPGAFPRRPVMALCSELTAGQSTQSAVRGACFLRKNQRRYVAWSPRMLAAARRNRWVGFRVAFYPVA